MGARGMIGMFAIELLLRIAGCFLLTCTVLLTGQYFIAWTRDRQARMLPTHVWMITLSYDLLLVAVMTRELDDWRAILYVPAVFLGAAGMYAVMRHLLETSPPRPPRLSRRSRLHSQVPHSSARQPVRQS